MRTASSMRVMVTPEGPTVRVAGREAWSLKQLINVGSRGLTPLDFPAGIRWAAYVYFLKAKGFDIATINEKHGGPFPGTHARYVLRSSVVVVEDQTLAA